MTAIRIVSGRASDSAVVLLQLLLMRSLRRGLGLSVSKSKSKSKNKKNQPIGEFCRHTLSPGAWLPYWSWRIRDLCDMEENKKLIPRCGACCAFAKRAARS